MKKFVVETYYTCTFKTVHALDDLNDKELSKIDNRTDGSVEVIDVKLNNRKTKKIGSENKEKPKNIRIDNSIPKSISNKIEKEKKISAKMLLQIHDELVFESSVKNQKDNEKLIKKVMTSVSSSEHHMFSIPLEVNVNSGYNWGDAH